VQTLIAFALFAFASGHAFAAEAPEQAQCTDAPAASSPPDDLTEAGATPTDEALLAAFRAYRAAIDRSGYTAAIGPGVKAWQISRAKFGDGGQTGVLALNAALALAGAKMFAEAYEPAAAALRIAQSDKRTDPIAPMAMLIVARARLSIGCKGASVAILNAVEAGAGDVDATIAYEALTAAFDFEIRKHDGAAAEQIASALSRVNRGAPFEAALAGPLADLRLAAASYMLRKYEPASKLIDGAYAALRRYNRENAGKKPTIGQVVYAQALAWRQIDRTRRLAHEMRVPPNERFDPSDGLALEGLPPPCELQLGSRHYMTFPEKAARDGIYGAVVVRVGIDEAGRVTHYRILAQVPYAVFAAEVDRAVPKWIMKATRKSVPGCRVRTDSLLVPVAFSF
jgi:TonB family protein